MEPQELIYCCNKPENNKPQKPCGIRGKCLSIISALIAIFLGVTLGLIIGANVATTIIGAMSAMIVLAIVFGVLLIINIIFELCNKTKDKC